MMNYVGSVSIIDRGDAPAKAVIDKNTRSLAQRVADETKQELTKVMDRVDNIYVSYEMSTQTMFENPRGSPNVEYIEDIKELEEIITDTVKKKKYQQQVTVFIVGFQDICAQKMQLLQQVNQFFLENSKLEEDEILEDKPTIDLEEASMTVNESLNTAEELTKRLSDINQDMVDYLVNYANNKASNKNALSGYEKGKKKLEKSLESAKNDVNSLSEKLLMLQTELEEKDEKLQQIIKQLEGKAQEAIRYKTAAEVAKKSAEDNENHTSALQDEIQKRDEKIQELRSKLSRLEINLTESQFDTEMSKRRLDSTNVQTKERMAKLQEEVNTKKVAVVDAEREMAKMHRDELASLEKAHQQEIVDLKHNHVEEIAKLTGELDSVSGMLKRAERNASNANDEVDSLRTKIVEIQLNQPDPQTEKARSESPSPPEAFPPEGKKGVDFLTNPINSGKSIGEISVDDDQPVKQESRPSTKETKSSKKSDGKPLKTGAKSPNRGKEKGKGKDYADTGVQDEGGDPNRATVDKSNDPSRQPTRQSKNLEPVVEMGDQDFTDSFDLDDHESWSAVPPGHVIGRFSQYRRLGLSKIKELEEQLNVTLTKTHRKVNSLKMQFAEHKNKWENERKILIEQVEQAQKLQTDAEKEADAAMTQLEEFINEQEKLEDEEETKRQEIIKTMSRPGTVKRGTSVNEEKKPERKTSVGEKGAESPGEERLQSENSEQELKNLMQQTDDAKANTPDSQVASNMSGLAPWLNSPQKKVKPFQPSDPPSDPPSVTSFVPTSRLTSVADAEIQNIVPDDVANEKQSLAPPIEHDQENSEEVKPIDGLKGERERLMSRTSTRLSRQRKRPLSRNIDEEDELEGENSDDGSRMDSRVAPWFTMETKKPVKRSPSNSSQSPQEDATSNQGELKSRQSLLSAAKVESISQERRPDAALSNKVNEVYETSEEEDSVSESEDEIIEVKRPMSVEVICRRSRPSVSRIQQRSKSTALEDFGKVKKEKKKEKTQKKKRETEKDITKVTKTKDSDKVKEPSKPKDTKTVSVSDQKKVQDKKNEPKDSKQTEKRSKTSFGHQEEKVTIREGAKTAPNKEIVDVEIDDEDDAGGELVEMSLALPSEENELISALDFDKNRSVSKVSNYVGDLDSRRSMMGTAVMGKITQMTDATLPVAMDTDSEDDEVEDVEKGQDKSEEKFIGESGGQPHEVEEMELRHGAEITRPLTDEEKVRERSRSKSQASVRSDAMSRPISRPGFETGRSGALGGLGMHQATPLYTSQSDTLPTGRYTVQSTHHQIVSVEVLQQETPRDAQNTQRGYQETPRDAQNTQREYQETPRNVQEGHVTAETAAPIIPVPNDSPKVTEIRAENAFDEKVIQVQEKHARHQTGAISAPPSMESEDEKVSKKPDLNTPREDEESEPVLPPSRQPSAAPSIRRNLSQQKPPTPKQAFRTPRPIHTTATSSPMTPMSFDSSIDLDADKHVAMETLAPSQTDCAMNSLKTMMEEEKFNLERQKTLDSLRTALKTVSSAERPLQDVQLERTVTILSLASQIAQESIELGILPDGVFSGLGNIDSGAMSAISGKDVTMKGSALSKQKGPAGKPELSDKMAKQLDGKREKTEEPAKLSKPEPQPELQHQQVDKKKKSRPRSPRSPTPKMFEIKKEVATKPRPSAMSSPFTEFSMSGSMDMEYASTRGDSFSVSIPDTLTSSEWRKVTHHDHNSPNAPKSAKVKKMKSMEVKEKSDKPPKQVTVTMEKQDEVTMEKQDVLVTIEMAGEPEKSDVTKPADGETKASPAISPKKKTRQISVEEMLFGQEVIQKVPKPMSEKIPKPKSDVASIKDSETSDKTVFEGPEPMMVKGQLIPKQPSGRIGTAERKRTSRSSKPSSAKSKSSPRSPQPQNARSEPPSNASTMGLNRQTSFASNRTLLTAPTPGTHVSDFERPPSKGSCQSVETISVSVVNTVPSGGGANADLSRPLSISSVKPVICSTPPPHLCKETQTDLTPPPEIEHEPIIGNTEEEVRSSSAKSRASLRNQFKNRLDSTRQAAEDRRTKSPIIPVPTQKSVDDELIYDDDDDDDIDLPIPDDLKEEALQRDDTIDAGTSPPPVPKHSKRSSLASRQNLSDHPVVQQYLRAYTGVHNFKEALSRIMVDKDQMSAHQILADLEMMPFDREDKVVPQIETMTENIYYVLNELSLVINSVLQNDRGPVVSSLMMGMSRDTTRGNIRERTGFNAELQPPTRSSLRSASTKAESMISDSKYKELNDQYEKLQNQMSEDAKRYEDQQRHNMVVMMEMQDTINQLQRELSALGKQGRRPMSEGASTSVTATQQQQQDSAIMFTRLDSERNAKIMKKAVNEEKLDPSKYKEVVVQMDDYINLPAQRLAHLVRKYVHHCRMKEIEENVQQSKSLNENVFEILDKMEALQNQRAKRWADRMDDMGAERLRLANMLMETLDGIEQESGIFLIKPMYSYRGRETKDRFSAKMTRPLRPQRTLSPLRDNSSAYAPAPTPASNVRPYMRHTQPKGDTNVYSQSHDYSQPRSEIQGPLDGNSTGLMGSSVNYVGIQPKSTWSMNDSQPQGILHSGTISNTPRILELDINRMMIGQNTISAHIGNQVPSNDRLVNATSNSLRSYMTVNRPSGPSSAGKSDRPTSGSRGVDRSSASPTSHSPSGKHVRLADIEVPTVIPNTQPLPPIGQSSTTPDRERPTSSEMRQRTPTRIPSGDDVPASPPGSSLRQSPVENETS